MDHARTLYGILLKIGGLRLDEALGNFTDSRVVDFLSEYETVLRRRVEKRQETPFPDWRKPLDPVQCHRNCADLRVYAPIGLSDYRIVYGWALSDNGRTSHSWCIKRNGPENIIETTRPRVSYFGFVLPDEVHLLSYIVPSTLGNQLEKCQSSTSASATRQT